LKYSSTSSASTSANVEFHLMPKGGAVAAKEGTVSTKDKVLITSKR